MTEAELIEGCLRKNSVFQKSLYDQYSGKMYVLCLRYAGSRMEAEDILQDGFIKVFDNISKFRMEGSLEGWIRKIMVNTALQYLRKTSHTLIDNRADAYQNMEIHAEDNDYGILSRISATEIVKLISQLPLGYRTVFNLYAIDGYSHKEIAGILDINESTSRSQLVKARTLLQTKIKKSVTIYHGK